MNQTVIHYGPVSILHCQTRRFDQQQVTDPSGIAHEYSQITFTVEGYLRVSGSGGSSLLEHIRIQPSNFASISGQRQRVADRLFHHHSYPFQMGYASQESGSPLTNVLRVEPSIGAHTGKKRVEFGGGIAFVDVNGGPRCTDFNILKWIGGTLAKVSATFQLCIVPCESGGDNEDERVILNRWSVTDSIDVNEYTTRTYVGRLRVSSPNVPKNLFRGYCVPPLAPGMKRNSMEFQVTEDGLSLGYTIVDKEAPFAAPQPATTWEVIHTETFADAKIGTGTIQATFRGNRNVNKRDLLALGIAIIEEKLLGYRLDNPPDKRKLIDNVTMTDVISSDAPAQVTITCDVRHITAAFTLGMGGPEEFGKPLSKSTFENTVADPYHPDESRVAPGDGNIPRTKGLSGPITLAGAFEVALRSACSFAGMPNAVTVNASDIVEPHTLQIPAASVETVSEVPEELPPYVSIGHATAAYTEYRVESKWTTRQARLQLPGAVRSGVTAGDGSTSALILLGAGATHRLVRIQADRIGDPPQLQEPEQQIFLAASPSPLILTLLSATVLPAYEVTIGGVAHWRVDAEYAYAANREITPGENLLIGVDASLAGPVKFLPGSALTAFRESDPSLNIPGPGDSLSQLS